MPDPGTNVSKYLKSKEWIAGNGQCPECYGVSPRWHGHPLHLTSDTIGHKPNCELANALRELGQPVIFIGDFKSTKEFEIYLTDDGFLSTRIKTKDGCPKIKKINEEWREELDEMLFKYLTSENY